MGIFLVLFWFASDMGWRSTARSINNFDPHYRKQRSLLPAAVIPTTESSDYHYRRHGSSLSQAVVFTRDSRGVEHRQRMSSVPTAVINTTESNGIHCQQHRPLLRAVITTGYSGPNYREQ